MKSNSISLPLMMRFVSIRMQFYCNSKHTAAFASPLWLRILNNFQIVAAIIFSLCWVNRPAGLFTWLKPTIHIKNTKLSVCLLCFLCFLFILQLFACVTANNQPHQDRSAGFFSVFSCAVCGDLTGCDRFLKHFVAFYLFSQLSECVSLNRCC